MTEISTPLKLVAFDTEDLSVLSAHVQDADLRPTDMTYSASEKRFVMVLARYDWQAAVQDVHQRVETGLHFDHVTSVATQNITRGTLEPLTLRAITFKAAVAPSGALTLNFANGGAIRLEVECIDAQLRDMDRRWDEPNSPPASLKGETEFGN